jgi:hypothetical protein
LRDVRFATLTVAHGPNISREIHWRIPWSNILLWVTFFFVPINISRVVLFGSLQLVLARKWSPRFCCMAMQGELRVGKINHVIIILALKFCLPLALQYICPQYIQRKCFSKRIFFLRVNISRVVWCGSLPLVLGNYKRRSNIFWCMAMQESWELP